MVEEESAIPTTVGVPTPAVVADTPKRSPPDITTELTEEIQVSGGSEAQILRLLEEPTSAATITAWNELIQFFGVSQWRDLEVFDRNDVSEWFKSNHSDLKRVIQKRLGFIVEYARYNVIHDSTTMREITTTVIESTGEKAETVASTKSSSDDSVKKSVPTLPAFTGVDEDYYTWREQVINDLGTQGLGKYVLMDDAHSLAPDVSESVFYALKGSLSTGLASNQAQSLYDDSTFNPRELWLNLEAYYDTSINRANINVYETRRLFGLVLNEHTCATNFISDMRTCLQRLKRHKAKIGEDLDTLCAFLLIAIQDDDFDSVRDSILESPNKTIEELLGEIRTKEASMMIKQFGPKGLKTDGAPTSARRTNSSKPGSNKKVHDAIKNGDWVIPTFPPGWKNAIGDKLFKVLCDWRNNAIYKHSSQKVLDDNYSLRVENVGKKHGNSSHRGKARKVTIKDDNDESDNDNIPMDDVTGKPWQLDPDNKRRRITLNKGNRIVTEKK